MIQSMKARGMALASAEGAEISDQTASMEQTTAKIPSKRMLEEDPAMESDEDDAAVREEKIINEEYKVWKKNAPYLYDVVVTHALEWPSLTVEWMPDVESLPDREYCTQRLLLGTHTDGGEPNFVQLATVQLPKASAFATEEAADESSSTAAAAGSASTAASTVASSVEKEGEFGGYGQGQCRINVVQRIPHDGEVNRARRHPTNPTIIATRTVSGEVHIFDYTKHPSQPAASDSTGTTSSETISANPQLRLVGQTADGYGLSWSEKGRILLAGASEDGSICVWDVEDKQKEDEGSSVQPLFSLANWHGRDTDGAVAVEDVCWGRIFATDLLEEDASPSSDQQNTIPLLASVGDDGRLIVWDLNRSSEEPWFVVEQAHQGEINCVAFNPVNPNLLATGGSDSIVALWDLRRMVSACADAKTGLAQSIDASACCVHRMEGGGHVGEVFQLAWSPHMAGVLASAAADRRVLVWDLLRIGAEQDAEDAEDGPPELLFSHGGHTAKVSDLAWNPNVPWMLASVAEDNICQIWQMSSDIYQEDSEDDDSSDDGEE